MKKTNGEVMSDKVQHLISIIIPIYNAEQYLPRCLNSIVNQDYKAIEVICINDSSTDNSLQIAEEYAKEDKRVCVYSKKNEGVSKARNYGLQFARGSFVMFVDADDWIEINTCSQAMQEIMCSDSDAVIWGYISEYENNSEKKLVYSDRVIFNSETVKTVLQRRIIGLQGNELAHPEAADSLSPAWGKMYKKKIIDENELSFIDTKYIGSFEDGLFNIDYLQCANSAVFIPQCLYHYRRHNASSVTTKFRSHLPAQWDYLFSLIENRIREWNLSKEHNKALQNRKALSILGLGLNVMASTESMYVKMKMLYSIVSKDNYRNAVSGLEIKYMPIHWRIFYESAKYRVVLVLYILLAVIRKKIYG